MNTLPSIVPPRGYQREMFDRSMEGNRIIIMDTGSGKTRVASLRIQVELERCTDEQRVWFLTPSVELCAQQHKVLQEAMPSYKMLLLTGQDNVDRWSTQKIWDAALDRVRLVVSTHDVLKDALRHGFVRISSLALLCFDEAHHCTKNHGANIIMRDFYHPAKESGLQVPHILGLSASLVMSSDLKSLETIEMNLDSIAVTPRLKRQELMHHVSRPDIRTIRFDHQGSSVSEGLQALHRAVLDHKSGVTQSSMHQAFSPEDIKREQRTLEKFAKKGSYILEELGESAADFFIRETIMFLHRKDDSTQDMQLDMTATSVRSLLQLFEKHGVEHACQQEGMHFPKVSEKVRRLLEYLKEDSETSLCGIVFVNQRVVASILSSILNDHHLTGGGIQCVPSVGGSNSSGRKFNITELLDRTTQKEALPSFRDGRMNLIVSTNVLEEGIDVQACNVVACFDLPTNLKSYIQRRGRARQQKSRYGLFLGGDADPNKVAKWAELERELIARCQEDRKQAERYICLESEDEVMDYSLEVKSTGAKLDATAAVGHLYHFCQTLRCDPSIDTRPEFTFTEDRLGQITAHVTLPYSIPLHARHASSKKRWRSEKAARKDAAFQAYAALFDVGLLNDHLLPLSQEWADGDESGEAVSPSSVTILPLDLWSRPVGDDIWYRLETVIMSTDKSSSNARTSTLLALYTRQQLTTPPVLKLYWDAQTTYLVSFGDSSLCSDVDKHRLRYLHQLTAALYRAPRSEHHSHVDEELLTLFELPQHGELLRREAALPPAGSKDTCSDILVRAASRDNAPHVFRERTVDYTILATRLPKRRNFVKRPASARSDSQRQIEVFTMDDCTVQNIPFSMAKIGLFMPDILQTLHDCSVAQKLADSLFPDVNSLKAGSVLTAITTPSAARAYDHRWLAFLGDGVLKYLTSCRLFQAYPHWPEGFLSQRRAFQVCNFTLANAVTRAGLDRYIIGLPVEYHKWALPSAKSRTQALEISVKTLADVIQALIGAFWLDVGPEAAERFIDKALVNPSKRLDPHQPALSGHESFTNRRKIETLIGYTFHDPSLLLQALTHPSLAQQRKINSYERLSFLGDAVLDIIIVELMTERKDKLGPGRMTQVKAALVNADLLSFFCFDLRHEETYRTVRSAVSNRDSPVEFSMLHEQCLADFMAFHPHMSATFRDNRNRFESLRSNVRQEMHHGAAHPWDLLEDMKLSKMFSNMVESILGAILLDSGEQLASCRSFLSRLGLLQYGTRMIDEEMDVMARRTLTEEETLEDSGVSVSDDCDI